MHVTHHKLMAVSRSKFLAVVRHRHIAGRCMHASFTREGFIVEISAIDRVAARAVSLDDIAALQSFEIMQHDLRERNLKRTCAMKPGIIR